MDSSHSNYQAGPDLPRPQIEADNFNMPETGPEGPLKVEEASKVTELPQATGGAQSNTPQQAASNIGVPLIPPPIPAGSHTSIQSAADDTPQIAEDNDLIEQAWIDKAKAIVDRTREDPHQQNKEINRIKADYIKKRYNKDIKVSED